MKKYDDMDIFWMKFVKWLFFYKFIVISIKIAISLITLIIFIDLWDKGYFNVNNFITTMSYVTGY